MKIIYSCVLLLFCFHSKMNYALSPEDLKKDPEVTEKVLTAYVKAWQQALHTQVSERITHEVKALGIESVYLTLKEWHADKLIPRKIFALLDSVHIPELQSNEAKVAAYNAIFAQQRVEHKDELFSSFSQAKIELNSTQDYYLSFNRTEKRRAYNLLFDPSGNQIDQISERDKRIFAQLKEGSSKAEQKLIQRLEEYLNQNDTLTNMGHVFASFSRILKQNRIKALRWALLARDWFETFNSFNIDNTVGSPESFLAILDIFEEEIKEKNSLAREPLKVKYLIKSMRHLHEDLKREKNSHKGKESFYYLNLFHKMIEILASYKEFQEMKFYANLYCTTYQFFLPSLNRSFPICKAFYEAKILDVFEAMVAQAPEYNHFRKNLLCHLKQFRDSLEKADEAESSTR